MKSLSVKPSAYEAPLCLAEEMCPEEAVLHTSEVSNPGWSGKTVYEDEF